MIQLLYSVHCCSFYSRDGAKDVQIHTQGFYITLKSSTLVLNAIMSSFVMRGLTALTGAVTGTHCMDEKVLWTCHRAENQVFMKSIQMEHPSIKEWSLPKANQISSPELQHQRCLRRRTQQIPSTTIQDNSGTEDEWREQGMSFYSRGEFF